MIRVTRIKHKRKRYYRSTNRSNTQSSNEYFSVRTHFVLCVYVVLWRDDINSNIRVIKYEYDQYFKFCIWVEVWWHSNKYECVQVLEIICMIRFYSSFWILIVALCYIHDIGRCNASSVVTEISNELFFRYS